MKSNCEEFFLSDVVRVMVFGDGFTLPVPAHVPGLTSFYDVQIPDPLVSVGYDGDVMAKENSITCKQSVQQKNGMNLYIYNVEMNIEPGADVISAVLPDIIGTDHNIVVELANGDKFLLYPCQNTFSVDYVNTIKDATLKIALTSLNDYIKI